MGPIGILIWSAVILYKIYFLYTKVFQLSKPQVEGNKNDWYTRVYLNVLNIFTMRDWTVGDKIGAKISIIT